MLLSCVRYGDEEENDSLAVSPMMVIVSPAVTTSAGVTNRLSAYTAGKFAALAGVAMRAAPPMASATSDLRNMVSPNGFGAPRRAPPSTH